MISLQSRSPLAGLHGSDTNVEFKNAGLALKELGGLCLLNLQGSACDQALGKAIEQAVGLLPKANRVAEFDQWACAWLTPKEWLFISHDGRDGQTSEADLMSREQALIKRLQPALEGHLSLVTVISDSRVGLSVRGKDASNLLAKGCGVDLHPALFKAGHCATTRFAGIACFVRCVRQNHYELMFDRPAASYVWQWLLDAAGEFS